MLLLSKHKQHFTNGQMLEYDEIGPRDVFHDCTQGKIGPVYKKAPLWKCMNHGLFPWALKFIEINFLADTHRLPRSTLGMMCCGDLKRTQEVLVFEKELDIGLWVAGLLSSSLVLRVTRGGPAVSHRRTQRSHLVHPRCVTSCLNFPGCFYLVMHLNHQGSSKQLWWR